MAFVLGPVHKEAISVFPKIATGKTIGYEAEAAPTWEDALVIWDERGRAYAAAPDARA